MVGLLSPRPQPEYPGLTRPPPDLQMDELPRAMVERMLKAPCQARPASVREFVGLACQHMRRERNDRARRLDKQPAAVGRCDGPVPSPAASVSELTPDGRRMTASRLIAGPVAG
jgi:hypothetical protein